LEKPPCFAINMNASELAFVPVEEDKGCTQLDAGDAVNPTTIKTTLTSGAPVHVAARKSS
jgi:hypothetical protein